jgi:hypothetical protein
VAVTLPDLIEEGVVESKVDRVKGRPRRVKVYNLSFNGGRRAGELVQQLLPATVTAVDGTGEWDLPLDGLIQLHRVHMMVALRSVDADNRIDLEEARALTEPKAGTAPPEVEVEPEEEAEPEVDEEIEEEEFKEVDEEVQVTSDPPTPTLDRQEVVHAPPVAAQQVPGQVLQGRPPPGQPMPGQAPMQGGQVPRGYGQPVPQWPQNPQDARQLQYNQYYQHAQYQGLPPPQYFWSPLRFGSGRRPAPGSVVVMLVMGFFAFLGGMVFFGLGPSVCLAIWMPLMVVGAFFAYSGLRNSWTLGPNRETWVGAALAAYTFIVVTWVALAVYGYEALVDLLWVALILGIPSLVLIMGSGRDVSRRGTFTMLVGPVVVIAALTMAVLDPTGFGVTGALPLLLVTVGASWTFVGWVMIRHQELVLPIRTLIAGGAIGLAIAAGTGAWDIWSRGELTTSASVAVTLWVGGAAYVALVSIVPSMEHLRPDLRATYSALAVAGSAALLVASLVFLTGGLFLVGAIEVVIALAMIGMVLPELKEAGSSSYVLSLIGSLVAVSSVLAFSVVV